jgi:hypothetical protein
VLQERAELVKKLRRAKTVVEVGLVVANSAIAKAIKTARTAVDEYNKLVAEAESFRSAVEGDIEDFVDEKGFDWQCTDEGQEYQYWYENWRDVELLEIAIDLEPDEMAIDGAMDHADHLEKTQNGVHIEGGLQ